MHMIVSALKATCRIRVRGTHPAVADPCSREKCHDLELDEKGGRGVICNTIPKTELPSNVDGMESQEIDRMVEDTPFPWLMGLFHVQHYSCSEDTRVFFFLVYNC